MTEYVYRVTRERRNPGFWRSAVEVKIRNKRSLTALLRYMADIEKYATKQGVEPSEKISLIERAQLGPWEEITTEEEIL